ncbi:unnamed protein product [marine sediment metagenome]|uniref:Uncharacterized protein n=1 Tax=marine sediment metagenome TaxID=412755 RepID=X1VR44_9ZZZZ
MGYPKYIELKDGQEVLKKGAREPKPAEPAATTEPEPTEPVEPAEPEPEA